MHHISAALVGTAILLSCTSAVLADPNNQLVTVKIQDNAANLTAFDGTNVTTVQCVFGAVKRLDLEVASVSVRSTTRLPVVSETGIAVESPVEIVIFVSDRTDGGKGTAYLYVSTNTPFKLTAALAQSLQTTGIKECKLLSASSLMRALDSLYGPAQTAAVVE